LRFGSANGGALFGQRAVFHLLLQQHLLGARRGCSWTLPAWRPGISTMNILASA